MDEALKRAGWIGIAVLVVAYLTFLVANSAFNSNSATSTPIVVRDLFWKNQHHLSGMIYVPESCDEVSVNSQKISDNEYQLAFTTWQEPEVKCMKITQEKSFDVYVFAPPEGITFSATLDKTPIPIAVYPMVNK